MSDVSSSGTFVKNPDATWNLTGGNGIPSGWSTTSPFSFGGLQISPGPLYWDDDRGKVDIHRDWTYTSYGSRYGLWEHNSTYFSFLELGKIFEKTNFTKADGDIDNLLNPLNGWRLPTRAEWCTLTTGESPGTARTGSTVNGIAGCKFALIRLSGYKVTNIYGSNIYGLLLFPDGKTIYCKQLNGINNNTINIGITITELNFYLEQGCVFLPSFGMYGSQLLDEELGEYEEGWFSGDLYYWSSSQVDNEQAYGIKKMNSVLPSFSDTKEQYFAVRLVRDSID